MLFCISVVLIVQQMQVQRCALRYRYHPHHYHLSHLASRHDGCWGNVITFSTKGFVVFQERVGRMNSQNVLIRELHCRDEATGTWVNSGCYWLTLRAHWTRFSIKLLNNLHFASLFQLILNILEGIWCQKRHVLSKCCTLIIHRYLLFQVLCDLVWLSNTSLRIVWSKQTRSLTAETVRITHFSQSCLCQT